MAGSTTENPNRYVEHGALGPVRQADGPAHGNTEVADGSLALPDGRGHASRSVELRSAPSTRRRSAPTASMTSRAGASSAWGGATCTGPSEWSGYTWSKVTLNGSRRGRESAGGALAYFPPFGRAVTVDADALWSWKARAGRAVHWSPIRSRWVERDARAVPEPPAPTHAYDCAPGARRALRWGRLTRGLVDTWEWDGHGLAGRRRPRGLRRLWACGGV